MIHTIYEGRRKDGWKGIGMEITDRDERDDKTGKGTDLMWNFFRKG